MTLVWVGAGFEQRLYPGGIAVAYRIEHLSVGTGQRGA
jgi:hypothetical protein